MYNPSLDINCEICDNKIAAQMQNLLATPNKWRRI